MARLLAGRQLKRVFEHFCPFEKDGTLRSEEDRVTVLASNVNPPIELEARSFVMAAAQGRQSPMVIQLSYNCINLAGGNVKDLNPPEGVTRLPHPSPAVDGAEMSVDVIRRFADQYGARYVAVSLDHFNVPKFDPALFSAQSATESLNSEVALARIKDAVDFMEPVFGKVEPDEKTLTAYVNYLSSPDYTGFRRDFVNVVAAIRPAWGMIDTERLPPVLNFAVTREVSDAVKKGLGNRDVIIEAEFGATGQSGEAVEYGALRGRELERFAEEVACFVKYTGAEGIAYPIGMRHAAKIGETHEADVERLTAVQRKLYLDTGGYVPFAQHGGTGAAAVVKGLVGKDNINTRYLVVGANAFADHYEAHRDAVRAGDKSACGTVIYSRVMVPAVYQATIEKLRETGSYQKGPELATVI